MDNEKVEATIAKKYYTVEEVRILLGCGKTKIYRIIALPTFPKTKIGHIYYINRAEFEKWEKRNLYSEVKLMD